MPDIYAAFQNNTDESHGFTVVDQGRDRNNPPVVFNGYLEPAQSTDWIALYAVDDTHGEAIWARSGGPTQVEPSISDGSTVRMN